MVRDMAEINPLDSINPLVYADNEHLHPYFTTLEYSTYGTTWTMVNDLASVESPEMTRKPSNDTTLQSPNQMLLATPGWAEPSDPPFVCYVHRLQYNTFYGYFWTKTVLFWRL